MAVIVGDRDHPEVIGLVGYGNGHAHVINSVSEVADLPEADKLFIVAQTTQDELGIELHHLKAHTKTGIEEAVVAKVHAPQ